ncbi:MAG: TetR/AcrR family transcriptional regulator [Cyclobacteriaceae bacterium]
MTKDLKTEERIIKSAKEVFVRKGMAGARMQEIADHAGINKALLHYYYRSKDQLFSAIFKDTMSEFLPTLFSTLVKDIPLEAKIYTLAEAYIEFFRANPYMPMFILSEIQRDPEGLLRLFHVKQHLKFDVLQKQLEEGAASGSIRPISVKMFMTNLMSMLVFPFVAKPMLTGLMGLADPKFDEFMEVRKTEVPKFIMNALRP